MLDGGLPVNRWTPGGPPEIPYGRPRVADRPKIRAEFVLAQRSTEPRYAVRDPAGLEWKLRVGVSSSLIDTDYRPLPRDFGWSRESQWRHHSSDRIGRRRLKLATGQRDPYWRRKGPKAGLLGELFSLIGSMSLAVLSRPTFQMKRWGAGGVGRGPSQDGLLEAASFLVRYLIRVPWIMSRPVSRLIARPIARSVARSVVVLRLVH
jgi:hypothetical protein